MKKILIIRLSALGDIVLTSPIVRCVKQAYPNCELHFLVKEKFVEAVESNSYVDKFHLVKKSLLELSRQLKAENFDCIIDLQKNRKTRWLTILLNKPTFTFRKLNVLKYLLVHTKVNNLPKLHVVDRYFEQLKKIKVVNDNRGLDFFINYDEVKEEIKIFQHKKYIVFVLGATFTTKQLPTYKWIEIGKKHNGTVILLGGKKEIHIGNEINASLPLTINLVGKLSLNESAFILKYAGVVVTGDTGLMHIAAALNKRIVSIWGNTVPDFGMYPYMPQEKKYVIIEKKISCRPCSKLGFHECPKKHFNCMDHSAEEIAKYLV